MLPTLTLFWKPNAAFVSKLYRPVTHSTSQNSTACCHSCQTTKYTNTHSAPVKSNCGPCQPTLFIKPAAAAVTPSQPIQTQTICQPSHPITYMQQPTKIFRQTYKSDIAPTIVTKPSTKRVRVPCMKKVRVPTCVTKIVPTTVRQCVPTSQLVHVPTFQTGNIQRKN